MLETFHIKNMVCLRCIRVVDEALNREGFYVKSVDMGFAVIETEALNKKKLSKVLNDNGFELLEGKTSKLIKDLKTFIVQFIRSGKLENEKLKFSAVLEKKFGKSLGYLGKLYSQAENNTLEKYILAQKIEYVKELIVYNELTLTEISFQLGYSSVTHLSSQFRQVTGFSATQFKTLKKHHRKSIDQL